MSDFSVICAIEAGRLEAQTLLMLATLKRFGGALGAGRIVAFQGRSGEKVSAETRKRLADMDVEYVFRSDLNLAPWFNYTNKIAAVTFAQQEFDTPWRVWVDSDILFLDVPSFVSDPALSNTDFLARFEYLAPGVIEPDSRFDDYWARVCAMSRVDFNNIAFHDLDLPPRRMKPYFNSGFFSWRAETAFAETYAKTFYRLLQERVAPAGIGPWFADQVSLTPTIEALQLRWRMLKIQDHLMMFTNALENQAMVDTIPQANVVHYSKSRSAHYRSSFDSLILARRPELEDLLNEFDAYDAEQRIGPTTQLRKSARRLRQAVYARRCRGL